MKNSGNQPTKTELFENTVSHISKFSWKTSEGKNLKFLHVKKKTRSFSQNFKFFHWKIT
ncbi:unnamed protein product [Ceutorhynchus assimilis]|uniref:Uncharacterized protein n=1 Tax=Ceutorhynchus assimilis TaxID=467358 RepID=A0A9N9QGQ6_9CUCU|nr:unnamed protein product [Ceutorhynchus assimilis]